MNAMCDPLYPAYPLLLQAWRGHVPCDAQAVPQPGGDDAAAYAIHQALGQELGWWAGGVPRNWKTGATGVGALPTSAPLPDAGVWASPADARAWPMHQCGVEAEIAFRLGADVTAAQAQSLGQEDVHALLDGMAVSIELVDFRWQQGLHAPAWLKLADLQSHSALVLGAWVDYTPRDWAAQTCVARWGAHHVAVQGAHPLHDPLVLMAPWLRHATTHFGTVAAGTVVTTGSWIGLPFAQRGDVVEVEFAGVGQACVQL